MYFADIILQLPTVDLCLTPPMARLGLNQKALQSSILVLCTRVTLDTHWTEIGFDGVKQMKSGLAPLPLVSVSCYSNYQ